MIAGMYAITFTLFALETGCLYKAATFGFVAAGLKSGFSIGHYKFWDSFGGRDAS
jgi:hypothetical protein